MGATETSEKLLTNQFPFRKIMFDLPAARPIIPGKYVAIVIMLVDCDVERGFPSHDLINHPPVMQ